jgi:hypothetical protein
MARWTISEPQRLTLPDPVDRLDVQLVAGRLNVVATDGPARVEVTRTGRSPIAVEHRDGRLSIRQDKIPKWPGILWWLRGRAFRVDVSIAVPVAVAADLRLIDGSVIVSGLLTETLVDVTSGQVTLHTSSGRITSAFPQVLAGAGPVRSADSRGVLGAGHGKLWATSASGSIALLARPVDPGEFDDEEVGP